MHAGLVFGGAALVGAGAAFAAGRIARPDDIGARNEAVATAERELAQLEESTSSTYAQVEAKREELAKLKDATKLGPTGWTAGIGIGALVLGGVGDAARAADNVLSSASSIFGGGPGGGGAPRSPALLGLYGLGAGLLVGSIASNYINRS